MICKNCQSEVSPYITECPYCGNRLRKRAPKLDRDGRADRAQAPRAAPVAAAACAAARSPGSGRVAARTRRSRSCWPGSPATLLWRAALVGSTHAIELWAQFGTHLWWRLLVAPFTYVNTGYAFVALGAIAVYGWLLERRHGPLRRARAVRARRGRRRRGRPPPTRRCPLALGANGGALALLIAWAIPDLLALRGRRGDRGRPARDRGDRGRRRADAAGRRRARAGSPTGSACSPGS